MVEIKAGSFTTVAEGCLKEYIDKFDLGLGHKKAPSKRGSRLLMMKFLVESIYPAFCAIGLYGAFPSFAAVLVHAVSAPCISISVNAAIAMSAASLDLLAVFPASFAAYCVDIGILDSSRLLLSLP